jgi:DNA-binding transcriptional MerR regulator
VSEKAPARKNAYKAAEVCDLAHIQPYVLRSWELEFPKLGVAKGPGGARVYRQADVEQVLRIKQLVFEQGLTLAGARRRLEDDETPQVDLPLDEMTPEARDRIARVKQGLRELLALLDGSAART